MHFLLKAGSHRVQAGLTLLTLRPPPPKRWVSVMSPPATWVCDGLRRTCRSHFWVSGLKLGSLGLAASPSTHCAILLFPVRQLLGEWSFMLTVVVGYFLKCCSVLSLDGRTATLNQLNPDISLLPPNNLFTRSHYLEPFQGSSLPFMLCTFRQTIKENTML